jgi:hypothetical protein
LTAKATLNGTITAIGGENCTERGFDWGTESEVYTDEWTEEGSYGTGTFYYEITGLDEDVPIYYRAKATNSGGTGYGEEQTFQTFKGVAAIDSGAGAEASVALSATLPVAETGAGAESSITTSVAFAMSDAGAGVEGDPSIGIAVADAGVGDETSVAVEATFSVTDSVAGSDMPSLTVEWIVPDAGTATEALGFHLTISETGTGVDALADLSVAFSITESGAVSEAWLLEVGITIVDAGVVSEAIALDVSFTIGESGTDSEVATLSVAMSVSESTAGADLIALSVSFTIADAGAGADVQSLTASFAASDFASGIDLVTGISTTFTITDAGTGADVVVPLVSVTVSDSGGLSGESWILVGYPLIMETGLGFELVSKDFGILESAIGAEFAWRLKGSTLIDSFAPPHVLSIRIRDEADMDTRLIQGGSLPKQKMLGKPGRVVEIEGWTRDQDDIDDMEVLMDGTARTFLHSSGDSFAVLVTDFDPESRVDEYDRRIYRLTLKETR